MLALSQFLKELKAMSAEKLAQVSYAVRIEREHRLMESHAIRKNKKPRPIHG